MPVLNFGGISKAIKESFSRGSIFLIRQVHKSNEINMTLPKDASKRIVWVDLEMTGLDVSKDHILEMSCLITDAELEVVAKGPSLIIHQPDEILKNMSKWCIEHHGESGLTEASRKSKITLQDAEQHVLKFVSVHVPKKKCPLGGNSVYMDRLFINKYMPNFNDYLHYRIIDVSSVKELARRWYPEEYEKQPPKMFKHRTLDDIMESIKELKYYKENVFKKLHDAESVVG